MNVYKKNTFDLSINSSFFKIILHSILFHSTQLHYAAQMSNGSGYQSQSANLALEILEIFLQQPNVQVDVCDRDGRQPLLWAASAGAVKAVLV